MLESNSGQVGMELTGAVIVAVVTIAVVLLCVMIAPTLVNMVHTVRDQIGPDETSPVYSETMYTRFDNAVDWWGVLAILSCAVALIYIPIVLFRRHGYNDEQRFRY
jgi:type II secretory pathway component PulF